MGDYNETSYPMGDDGSPNYNEYYPNDGGDPLIGNDDDDDDFDPFELLKSPLFGEDRQASANNSNDGVDDDYSYSSQQPQVHEQEQQQQQQGIPSMVDPSAPSSPPSYQVQSGTYGSQGRAPGRQEIGGYPQQQQHLSQAQYASMDMQQQQNYQQQMQMQQMQHQQQMQQGMPHQMQQNNYGPGGGMHGNPMMQQGNLMPGGNQNQMQQHGMPNMPPNMQMPGQYPQQMGPNANMQAQMGNMEGMANRSPSMNNAVNSLNASLNGLHVTGAQGGSMHGSMPSMQGPYQGGGAQGGRPSMISGGGSLPASPNPRMPSPSIAQMSASLQGRSTSSRVGGRNPRGQAQPPKLDANGKVIGNTSQDPGINEAMEKLCESMRRSAMSRNLVKQLSGRSLNRTGSAKSPLSRSNSGVGMRKQLSGRSLSGNLNGLADDGSGRGGTPTRVAPIRRLSDAKHRLQGRSAPGNRGAYRQNSMGSQSSAASAGRSTPKTFLQLDDQSLGAL